MRGSFFEERGRSICLVCIHRGEGLPSRNDAGRHHRTIGRVADENGLGNGGECLDRAGMGQLNVDFHDVWLRALAAFTPAQSFVEQWAEVRFGNLLDLEVLGQTAFPADVSAQFVDDVAQKIEFVAEVRIVRANGDLCGARLKSPGVGNGSEAASGMSWGGVACAVAWSASAAISAKNIRVMSPRPVCPDAAPAKSRAASPQFFIGLYWRGLRRMAATDPRDLFQSWKATFNVDENACGGLRSPAASASDRRSSRGGRSSAAGGCRRVSRTVVPRPGGVG